MMPFIAPIPAGLFCKGYSVADPYLSHLALDKHVAASTQNVALSALLFLYKHVVGRELAKVAAVRAKRPKRLPTVFSRDEVARILTALEQEPPPFSLVLSLLYGTGMRLMEGLRLRVKDVDFDYRSVTVRDGKGNKDRVTVLPASLIAPLHEQLVVCQPSFDGSLRGAERRGNLAPRFSRDQEIASLRSQCSRSTPQGQPIIFVLTDH